MKKSIFIGLSTFCEDDNMPTELLKKSGYKFDINNTGKRITKKEILEKAYKHNVIVAGVETYDSEIMSLLPNLECISRCGAGIDSIDLEFAKKNKISILNTPTVPVQAVSELALNLFLSLSRKLYQQSKLVHLKKWERIKGHLLSGRTIGLIGFGKIGKKVSQLSKAFGANIVVYDPFIKSSSFHSDIKFIDFDELLSISDIVSIHASKSSENQVFIGNQEFKKMKNGSIIVNLSRGDMIDEIALINAIKSGKISGVGLDVYPNEPYYGDLCNYEEVILTPHSATLTYETRSEMELQCVQNAINFLNENN